jgi:hypothetical protein
MDINNDGKAELSADLLYDANLPGRAARLVV